MRVGYSLFPKLSVDFLYFLGLSIPYKDVSGSFVPFVQIITPGVHKFSFLDLHITEISSFGI